MSFTSPHAANEVPDFPDCFSPKAATALAARIADYWHRRGYKKVWVEAYQLDVPGRFYGIRSNLVGGLPPQSVDVKVAA